MALACGPDGVMNMDVTDEQVEASANEFYDQLMARPPLPHYFLVVYSYLSTQAASVYGYTSTL